MSEKEKKISYFQPALRLLGWMRIGSDILNAKIYEGRVYHATRETAVKPKPNGLFGDQIASVMGRNLGRWDEIDLIFELLLFSEEV